MTDDLEFVPPFLSPLTHDQHARIGRIALVWGQVDMMLDLMLDHFLGITTVQRRLLIGEKPIGAKLDLLNGQIKDITDAELKKATHEFWDLANQTKTQRNKCFHGIWGLRCVRKNTVVPGASHFRSIGDPLKITQLPALEKKLCKTARAGMRVLVHLGQFQDHGSSHLFHGRGPAPAWLEEWIGQHRVDDDSLDRRWKLGQLLYLEKPV